MEKTNSKQIILSVIAVIVLVIAVVGVSFAMYTFSATGTSEATIQTASLNLTVSTDSGTTFTVTNQYPMEDTLGRTTSPALATVTITPTNPGGVAITYKLHFEEVSKTSGIAASNIRYAVVQSASNKALNTNAAVVANTGLVSAHMSEATAFVSDTINNQTAINYYIVAWLDSNYQLTQPATNTVTTASGTKTHTNTSTSDTYVFKVVLTANA